VLLVDDSAVHRQAVSKTLRRASSGGCEVLEASDGEGALSVLVDQDVDLVISDIQMPKMTGGELVEALRSIDRNADTPIVIVSALRDEAEQRRMQLLGVSAYLHKPVPPDVLLATVRSALGGRPGTGAGMSDELLLDVACEVFEGFASLIVDRAPRELEWEAPVLHAEIAFSGALVGSLGVLASADAMKGMAHTLLRLDKGASVTEAQAMDTLAELSSVLLGTLLARTLPESAPRQLGLPIVDVVDPDAVPRGSRSLLLWDPGGHPLRVEVHTLLEVLP
jgi:CheY-like chemotaxis protein